VHAYRADPGRRPFVARKPQFEPQVPPARLLEQQLPGPVGAAGIDGREWLLRTVTARVRGRFGEPRRVVAQGLRIVRCGAAYLDGRLRRWQACVDEYPVPDAPVLLSVEQVGEHHPGRPVPA